MEDTKAMRYIMDYDWVWGPSGDIATLRVSVEHDDPEVAEQAIARFLDGLSRDVNGIRGAGGWAVYPVPGEPRTLDLVSGGEDVADAIQDAADTLFDAVGDVPGLTLSWRQLPLSNELAHPPGSPTG